MGKRLIIQGVDYTNSAIGGAVTPEEPDTPVVPDVPDNPDVLSVQTIEPSLQDIASATTLVNRTIAIGSSRNPAQGGGYLRSVTSAVTGKYIRIVIVGADLNVISISDDIYLSEATTNIRNLNIYIPYDGYVAYANSETEQTGAIAYVNTGGQPHLEVGVSIGATASLNQFPTMRLALGCEIEITEEAPEQPTYDVEYGVKLDASGSGSLIEDATMATTNFLPIENSSSVTWGNSQGSTGFMYEYDDDKGKVDYWTAKTNPRTAAIKATSKFIRASFDAETLDYCYVKDETNGIYLFKGSKVYQKCLF